MCAHYKDTQTHHGATFHATHSCTATPTWTVLQVSQQWGAAGGPGSPPVGAGSEDKYLKWAFFHRSYVTWQTHLLCHEARSNRARGGLSGSGQASRSLPPPPPPPPSPTQAKRSGGGRENKYAAIRNCSVPGCSRRLSSYCELAAAVPPLPSPPSPHEHGQHEALLLQHLPENVHIQK